MPARDLTEISGNKLTRAFDQVHSVLVVVGGIVVAILVAATLLLLAIFVATTFN